MEKKKLEEVFYIAELIIRQKEERCSAEELLRLEEWINREDTNARLYQQILAGIRLSEDLQAAEGYDTEAMARRVFSRAGLVFPPGNIQEEGHPLSNTGKWRSLQWVAAAAVLGLLLIGAVWLLMQHTTGKQHHNGLVANGVHTSPGSRKPLLTLGNGTVITLDSTINGVIARQGSMNVVQAINGQLTYLPAGTSGVGVAQYNTITVPRGGNYELILSDSTYVHLNAASSLTYPTVFTGGERTVRLSGEAYFEVKRRPVAGGKGNMPFSVKILRPDKVDAEVKVLGTHFNIHAYGDEAMVRTTLAEGAVVVRKDNNEVRIRPGQEVVFTVSSAPVVKPADLEAALAWKYGRFLFKLADVREVMRMVARWYDVDVIYEGDLSDIHFSGDMLRKERLRDVLDILEADGRLHFKINGTQVLVSKSTNHHSSR